MLRRGPKHRRQATPYDPVPQEKSAQWRVRQRLQRSRRWREDPARAAMLHALMDGRALTASELARIAGVAPQTASGHLARMTETGLLAVAKQGRHRYHRLASTGVARMIEGIMRVASELQPPRKHLSVGPARYGAPRCPDVLRPPCRSSWRFPVRRTDRGGICRALGGVRRYHRARPGISRAGRDRRFGHAGAKRDEVGDACCAVRVSTGASGARIWRVSSAPHFARIVLRRGLSAGSRAPARCRSRPKGQRAYREKFGVRFE